MVKKTKGDLLIDRISIDLDSFHDKQWGSLYQADELDCSRMSAYLWDYIRSTDYYFLEATIPRIVADDDLRFQINDRTYSSSEFYNAAVYVFDTPQDANDFHAENSALGGWNQEFRLKKTDLDKIALLLK